MQIFFSKFWINTFNKYLFSVSSETIHIIKRPPHKQTGLGVKEVLEFCYLENSVDPLRIQDRNCANMVLYFNSGIVSYKSREVIIEVYLAC